MLVRNALLSAVAATAAVGFFAASASAQYAVPMTGAWYQNRGPLVDIPVNGGVSICGATGGTNVAIGCIGQAGNPPFRPSGGGIPDVGGQTVMVLTPGATPNALPRISVPPSAFGQNLGIQNTHVSIIPTVVQLDTAFTLTGPALETAGPNPDRILEPNAATVQTQTGRLALSFGWCPGVGGPACTDPRPAVNGNPGPENGLVRYSNPGGQGFGGTMAMLTNTPPGAGAIWVVVGTAMGPMNTPLLLRQAFSGMGRQHPGAGYAAVDTDALASGPIFLGFMTSNQSPAQTGLNGPMNGLITFLGPQVNTAPADMNTNWGFAWTTGTVFVQDIQTNMGAMATTTLSAMGTNNLNQFGEGNITLVAGGTSHRAGAVTDFKAFDIVTMTLPEPGQALMLGLSLSLIAGLYGLRRRF